MFFFFLDGVLVTWVGFGVDGLESEEVWRGKDDVERIEEVEVMGI
jgi:hypothetical protein